MNNEYEISLWENVEKPTDYDYINICQGYYSDLNDLSYYLEPITTHDKFKFQKNPPEMINKKEALYGSSHIITEVPQSYSLSFLKTYAKGLGTTSYWIQPQKRHKIFLRCKNFKITTGQFLSQQEWDKISRGLEVGYRPNTPLDGVIYQLNNFTLDDPRSSFGFTLQLYLQKPVGTDKLVSFFKDGSFKKGSHALEDIIPPKYYFKVSNEGKTATSIKLIQYTDDSMTTMVSAGEQNIVWKNGENSEQSLWLQSLQTTGDVFNQTFNFDIVIDTVSLNSSYSRRIGLWQRMGIGPRTDSVFVLPETFIGWCTPYKLEGDFLLLIGRETENSISSALDNLTITDLLFTPLNQPDTFIKENKLCTLKDADTNNPAAAFDCNLSLKENEDNTLTFSIYAKYYDNKTGKLIDNPYLPLLINERKVKLKYKDKWYDFIIKNISEMTENYKITYQAESLIKNELSKVGFNITYNTELENNTGNIFELAERAIQETNYSLNKTKSDFLVQTLEDNIYIATIPEGIYTINCKKCELNNKGQLIFEDTTLNLKPEGKLCFFYGEVSAKKNTLSCIYYLDDPPLESSNKISNQNYYMISDVTYKNNDIVIPTKNSSFLILSYTLNLLYRADRYYSPQEKRYYPLLDKYCDLYTKGNTTYYGYQEKEYEATPLVENYITNPNNFISTDGWKTLDTCNQNGKTAVTNLISLDLTSRIKTKDAALTRKASEVPILNWKLFGNTLHSRYNRFYFPCLYNTGFSDYSYTINQLNKGDKYALSISVLNNDMLPLNLLHPVIAKYNSNIENAALNESKENLITPYISFNNDTNNLASEKDIYTNSLVPVYYNNTVLKDGGAPLFFVQRYLANYWSTESNAVNFIKQVNFPSGTEYNPRDPDTSRIAYILTSREEGPGREMIKYFSGYGDYTGQKPKDGLNLREWTLQELINNKNTKLTYTFPQDGKQYYFSPINMIIWNENYFRYDVNGERKTTLESLWNDSTSKSLSYNGFRIFNNYSFYNPKTHATNITYAYKENYNRDTSTTWSKTKGLTKEVSGIPHEDMIDLLIMSNIWNVSGFTQTSTVKGEGIYGIYDLVAFGDYHYDDSKYGNLEYSDLIKDNFGLFILGDVVYSAGGESYVGIADCQLFKEYRDKDGNLIYPSEVNDNVNNTIYYYFNPGDNEGVIEANKMIYEYKGYYDDPSFIPKIDLTYEKKNSIVATESNVYDILLKLCETFDCWMDFEILHSERGDIEYDTQTYKPLKYLYFKRKQYQVNNAGFKYGINLKSIQRSIDSSNISTKLIVKSNSNEYGENGFCSIARAENNPIGENFILDLSYYINQGLISKKLFLKNYDNCCYLLRQLNNNNRQYSKNLGTYSILKSKYLAMVETYKLGVDNINKLLTEYYNNFYELTGKSYSNYLTKNNDSYFKEFKNNKLFTSYIETIKYYKKLIPAYKRIYRDYNNKYTTARKNYNSILTSINSISQQKVKILRDFYDKYAAFIQEGTWMSEDFMDDNIYYFSAIEKARENAFPKVSYTIDALEISALPEFKLYDFKIRDKTFIEDTEFFGWSDEEKITPYKEEVIVSEINHNLDNPAETKITIQNYRTDYEDLFQRMAATIKNVEYGTGNYSNVSSSLTTQNQLNNITTDINILQKQLNEIIR
jgi:hypothetical protein